MTGPKVWPLAGPDDWPHQLQGAATAVVVSLSTPDAVKALRVIVMPARSAEAIAPLTFTAEPLLALNSLRSMVTVPPLNCGCNSTTSPTSVTTSLSLINTSLIPPTNEMHVKTQAFRMVLREISTSSSGAIAPGRSIDSTRTRSPLPGNATTTFPLNRELSARHMLNNWRPQLETATGPVPHPFARVGFTARLSSTSTPSITVGPLV